VSLERASFQCDDACEPHGLMRRHGIRNARIVEHLHQHAGFFVSSKLATVVENRYLDDDAVVWQFHDLHEFLNEAGAHKVFWMI
jgi:hypothetical protein